jgi:hypothetical protein
VPAGSGWRHPPKALKGSGTRREVRGRILKPSTRDGRMEVQMAGPKGNGGLGSRNQ